MNKVSDVITAFRPEQADKPHSRRRPAPGLVSPDISLLGGCLRGR